MNSFFYNLHQLILRSPRLFVWGSLLFLILIVFIAAKLKLSENAQAILPQSKEGSELNEILENINLNDRIFFNIYFSDPSLNKQDELVAFARRLSDSLESSSGVDDIHLNVENQSVELVSHYVLRNLPFLLNDEDYQYFDSLLYGNRLQTAFAKKYKSLLSPASVFIKNLIISDPAGLSLKVLESLKSFQVDEEITIDKGYLFTPDKKHLLFFLTPVASASETAKNLQLIHEIDGHILQIQSEFQDDIIAEYFGAPIVAAGNAKQIKRDIILTVSIAIVMVVLLITFFYRSKRLFLIIFLPAGLAVLCTMAILYLIKGEVSAIALGLGSVLVGISIDYVLHIFTHFQKTESIKKVLEDVSEPIIISAITTATAFLGLLVVSSPALQDMGLFAGISIVFSALFSLIFIPLFLKKNTCTGNLPEKTNLLQKAVRKISEYPFHQKLILILALLILSPGLYYFSKEVRFQGDMNAINYMDAKTEMAENHLNAITKLSQRNIYVLSIGNDLEKVLVQNEDLEKKITAMDKDLVLHHTSVSSLLPSKKTQQAKKRNWEAYWTDEKKSIILEQLSIIEDKYGFKPDSFKKFKHWFQQDFKEINLADTELIKELFLNAFIQGNDLRPMVLTLIKTRTAHKAQVHQMLEKQISEGTYIIDKEYLTSQFVKDLQNDFTRLVSITLLLVFLIIWISFGRIELAMITFLPLMLSWIWTTGLMSIFGLEFNIVNIIISTFIFGLGIDYCIFITRGLIQEYKYGEVKLDSFKTSILFSAVTSILGVGVLIFAKHPALQSMAFVTVIGLSSVFLLSIVLQPLLFGWLIDVKSGKRRMAPITASNFTGSMIAILFFSMGSLFNTIAGFLLITLSAGKSKRTRLWYHHLLMITSKMMVYIMFNVKKRVKGLEREKFDQAAVIISNHQSHIDIMLMLMLNPKMILLTNDWVQRNFFYGRIVRMADFYPILDHLHEHVDLLRKKTDEGYSIMIFPEGTRSETGKIGRFHKGAFYLAEQLNLDVLPIILHGPGDCITKGEPFLKSGRIDIHVKDRISVDDARFGEGYVERSKRFRKWYQQEYEQMSHDIVGPDYMRKQLDMNYIYKGPVLEWYVKIKMNFEKNYRFFHELIPLKAHIIDLGCGYGMLDYMLTLLSKERSILGVDYDDHKIKIAQNNAIRRQQTKGQVEFITSDLNHWSYEQADVYILADVLHYLPLQEQEFVIQQAVRYLKPGGMIIIRDADTQLTKKHKGTLISEWQSTRLFSFNKTKDQSKKLYFGSAAERKELLESLGLEVELIDKTKMNSNVVLVAKKKNIKV